MPIKRVFLYAYKRGSGSCKRLQSLLTTRGYRVYRRDSSSRPTLRQPCVMDTVINWGNPRPPRYGPCEYYNATDAVALAGNKLAAFVRMQEAGVSIPEFTTDRAEATRWIAKSWIVCRKLLRASGGRGIVLAQKADELVNAPLYVKYRRKTHEYRVHIWKGTCIHIAQKRRRAVDNRGDNYNSYICNHDNSWVFCRPVEPVPVEVTRQAQLACEALHLDFGAVDVIYNSKKETVYVLEVNTAPGIEGTTLTKYAEAFYNDH